MGFANTLTKGEPSTKILSPSHTIYIHVCYTSTGIIYTTKMNRKNLQNKHFFTILICFSVFGLLVTLLFLYNNKNNINKSTTQMIASVSQNQLSKEDNNQLVLEERFQTRQRQVETYCQSYNWRQRFVGRTMFYNNSITSSIFCMFVCLFAFCLLQFFIL